MGKAALLSQVRQLIAAHQAGTLGGVAMPEDVHPDLPRDSKELLHYFTLGMALNYQRDSYALWRACTAGFEDNDTRWVFDPAQVMTRNSDDLRIALVQHRIALQPINHPKIWHRLCQTFTADFNGDVRTLLQQCDYDIGLIKDYLATHKKDFPYLGGPKISNYWLYVLTQYTSLPFTNRAALTVAPDTHICNASAALGLCAKDTAPVAVAQHWAELLQGTGLDPIDIHTPLWLWSRAGFPDVAGLKAA